MVESVVPSGFSSSAALTLLQTMKTASSSNERFMTSKMSSISAHATTTMSANTMFSIMTTIAASSKEIVSTAEDQSEKMAQTAGLQGDLALQFGATATATMSTTGIQTSSGALSGNGEIQASVTTATLQVNGSIEPGSGAAVIQEMVQNYVKNNSLSSAQISDALYSGASIGDSAVQGSSSFKDVINELYADAEAQSTAASNVATWLANGRPASSTMGFDGQSDEQVIDFVSEMNNNVNDLDTQANSMTAAFENHTLTFEKASDVKGLDYSETLQASAFVGRSGVDNTESMNENFLKQDTDGKQHAMFNIGAVEMYATW